ncbi:hypothetical protein [Rhizobium flavescens]|uniref:hypothetical protein n=1 Tax=Rhizobium flavescens TaxID=2607407 RepID=UPI001409D725|nr:hypothetical protein [Rhizobium flavescens]
MGQKIEARINDRIAVLVDQPPENGSRIPCHLRIDIEGRETALASALNEPIDITYA